MLTVEERLKKEFGKTFYELVDEMLEEGMPTEQIAERLDVGIANLRRIARKNNLSLQSRIDKNYKPFLVEQEEFHVSDTNKLNFLSRHW